jgi:arginyl-tRNA synthetase
LYSQLQRRLIERVRAFLRQSYAQIDVPNLVAEQPPRVEMGEYALPLAFELARKLRKAPRKIAEEIVAGLGPVEGFEKLEVAGAGYINARLHRASAAAILMAGGDSPEPPGTWHGEKVLVEHTSINPNKAAHIGHLRNAILGDTFVRLLRAGDVNVDVQNYIDNTGVQVADVVVGFVHLEKKSPAEVRHLIETTPRFDYLCWDLYAGVSQWYEQDKANLKFRGEMLHAIEQGGNEYAQMADVISTAILRRHLETMIRLGIEYDFLPRESEILRLRFWDSAFQQLKDRGVLYYENQGKNAGCWVMKRPGAAEKPEGEPDEDSKVIVRSNGTVGYVGKDIAYHLWKFGLLGKDFGYRRFYSYPGGKECWISAVEGETQHPHFGGVSAIYNVIDARQAEAQNAVIEALRGLGNQEQAGRYTHFSYEMVALTPRCAAELGYELSQEEWARNYIEVSGRRGFGVKADDLIDRLIESAQKEVDARHEDLGEEERRQIASVIAVGALRYFMLKFTKNSVIAFDFKDALSFEGETGPYAQYAVVRATNIFRKGGLEPERALEPGQDFSPYFAGESGNEIWELWLAAGKTAFIVEQCVATTEPAYAAKHAFLLAQLFNNFYHKHHILTEPDAGRKRFLLATAAVVRRELIRLLEIMGISCPPVM